MDSKDDLVLIGRRQVLRMVGLGVGSVAVLAACKKEEGAGGAPAAPAPAAKPASSACMDKVPVDDAAKQMRTVVQYKEKSDQAGKKCSTCVQYEAAKYGDCGGCKLFAGGVNPEGICLSYAPMAAAPAPGAAPAAAPAEAPKGG